VDAVVTKPLLRKEEDTPVNKEVAVFKLAIRARDNAIEWRVEDVNASVAEDVKSIAMIKKCMVQQLCITYK